MGQELEEGMIVINEKNNDIYILSIDAKDIYEANQIASQKNSGYNIRNSNGEVKLNKFTNTLSYSLDLIKLRNIFRSLHQTTKFSFKENGKEYSQTVINVTFKYAHKLFNQCPVYDQEEGTVLNYYIRTGSTFEELTFEDRVAYKDGELLGVCVGASVKSPLEKEKLGKIFDYDETTQSYRMNNSSNPTLLSRRELRKKLYKDGFYCDGKKYVRFKRSSGSSRVGKCLFIEEGVASRMRKWEKCGVPLREGQKVDLAAWEAYISLTLSSIIDTIEIKQENILLIEDYESTFEDTMMAVSYEDGTLKAEPKTTTISNSIWDGQSLLDSSMFAEVCG